MSGSSMATPHVAGLAALLFEASPSSAISAVEQAIFKSCKRGPGMSEDRSNRGFPSAVEALSILIGVIPGKKGDKKAAEKTPGKPTKGKTNKSGKRGAKKPAKAGTVKKSGSKKGSKKSR